MRHQAGLAVAVLGMVVGGAVARAAEEAWPMDAGAQSIVIRTYTEPAGGDMRTARRTAGVILERTGIRVAWLECSRPADPTRAASACEQPLRGNELVVRVVAAGPAPRPPHAGALGVALVDAEAGAGTVATVYADRVAKMATAAGVGIADLLGRAIAHEIGHLLLGTTGHARRGLMRASWSNADLRDADPARWQFGAQESAAMRRAVAARYFAFVTTN